MGLEGKTICLDPGHPSEVGEGTRGKQITELHAAWMVALRLKGLLEGQGARVVLTKKAENELVKNQRRAEIANAARVVLMVRLHCDSEAGSGFAVYYPTRQGRTKNGKVGPSPATLAACRAIAPRFFLGFATAMGGALKNRGLRSDLETLIGEKQGALTGSIYSEVPVVLVEMGVLSHPRDDAFLASEAGQETLGRALAAGVSAALE